jgi:hypothetical protein
LSAVGSWRYGGVMRVSACARSRAARRRRHERRLAEMGTRTAGAERLAPVIDKELSRIVQHHCSVIRDKGVLRPETNCSRRWSLHSSTSRKPSKDDKAARAFECGSLL